MTKLYNRELVDALAKLVDLPTYAVGDFTIRVNVVKKTVEIDCIYIPKTIFTGIDNVN